MFYSEDGETETANFTKSDNGILVIESEGYVDVYFATVSLESNMVITN
jgi:hypothetical protein